MQIKGHVISCNIGHALGGWAHYGSQQSFSQTGESDTSIYICKLYNQHQMNLSFFLHTPTLLMQKTHTKSSHTVFFSLVGKIRIQRFAAQWPSRVRLIQFYRQKSSAEHIYSMRPRTSSFPTDTDADHFEMVHENTQ